MYSTRGACPPGTHSLLTHDASDIHDGWVDINPGNVLLRDLYPVKLEKGMDRLKTTYSHPNLLVDRSKDNKCQHLWQELPTKCEDPEYGYQTG
jgi:hypothetical protein